jgi:hypothetical protein
VITEGEKEFANKVAGKALSGAFEGTGGFGCAGHVSQGRGETDQGIAQIVATEAELYGTLIDWDGLSFAAAAVEGKCGFEPDDGVLRISPAELGEIIEGLGAATSAPEREGEADFLSRCCRCGIHGV